MYHRGLIGHRPIDIDRQRNRVADQRAIMRCFQREDVLDKVFIVVMLVLFGAFAFFFVLDPGGNQALVFFHKTEDFFADYFNVAKISVDRNPYFFGLDDPAPQEHGYPPLCYLIFYFLSRFADYGNLTAFQAGYSPMGLTTAFLFVGASAALLFGLLREGYRKKGAVGFLLVLAIALSSVSLFSLERGNIILLTAALFVFFIVGYRSENKVIAELALIALAVATALKGYPALIGLLLLFDKKYIAALRCALYALALIVLPFLFFTGGFANIPLWLNDISANSKAYGLQKPAYGFGVFAYFGFSDGTSVKAILNVVDKIVCVVALVASCFQKVRWKQIMLVMLVIVCAQTNSGEYLGLYVLFGIVLFFDEAKHGSYDWVYVLLFVLFLNPLQLVLGGHNLTSAFMSVSVDALFLVLTFQSCGEGIRRIRGHRLKTLEN